MLFDDHRLFGQLADFSVGQAETRALGLVDFNGFDRATGLGLVAVDHLDGLAAQVTAQDGRAARFEGALVYVEFVRVDRALYDGFAQAVGAGDKHHVTETGFGIQGEHHTGSAGFRTHHALHAGRQGHQLVVETLVYAVGDRTVVKEGGKHFLGRADHVFDAANVEEGFLLAGKGGVRQVFGGGRGTHGDGHVRVTGRQGGEGGANFFVELLGELGFHDPLADLGAGLGQGVDVIDVQGVQRGVDLGVEAAQL